MSSFHPIQITEWGCDPTLNMAGWLQKGSPINEPKLYEPTPSQDIEEYGGWASIMWTKYIWAQEAQIRKMGPVQEWKKIT